jgi:hypothetical protein
MEVDEEFGPWEEGEELIYSATSPWVMTQQHSPSHVLLSPKKGRHNPSPAPSSSHLKNVRSATEN